MAPANTEALNRVPTLFIARDAWLKIKAFVDACKLEINGFALVKRIDQRTLFVQSADDVFITRQEVSLGSAEIDPETMAHAMAYAESLGRANELRLQWHSHVNGAAYFSSTDMKTIEEYGDIGAQWMISLVTNKSGDIMARLDQYGPVRVGVTIKVEIWEPENTELTKQVTALIEEHVREKPKPPKPARNRRWRPGGQAQTQTGSEDGDDIDADEDDEYAYGLLGELSDEDLELLRSL